VETAWHLKPKLIRHDGTPFTSDDLAFALAINRDQGLGFAVIGFPSLIESAESRLRRRTLERAYGQAPH
jgi:hypothetical protein